jgi:hypothetical protein
MTHPAALGLMALLVACSIDEIFGAFMYLFIRRRP